MAWSIEVTGVTNGPATSIKVRVLQVQGIPEITNSSFLNHTFHKLVGSAI